MAVLGDRTRRRLRKDTKGVSGVKTFVVDDWDGDVEDYDPALPEIGDAWSPSKPHLRCARVDADEIGGGVGDVVAEYSSDGLLIEDMWEVSMDYFLETVDNTRGWTWETAGTPVEQEIPSTIAVMKYVLRGKVPSPPTAAVVQALNRVNDRTFRTFAAGTMRLDGVQTSEQYNSAGQVVSVQTTYTWLWSEVGHNYEWRLPLADRDGNGNVIYYQNKDVEKEGYTTDPDLVGTVKYVSNTTLATADWDRPRRKADGVNWSYRYEAVDFVQLLGVPG